MGIEDKLKGIELVICDPMSNGIRPKYCVYGPNYRSICCAYKETFEGYCKFRVGNPAVEVNLSEPILWGDK